MIRHRRQPAIVTRDHRSGNHEDEHHQKDSYPIHWMRDQFGVNDLHRLHRVRFGLTILVHLRQHR